MADLHELVSRIKDLAIELGRTPSKEDLITSGVSDYSVRRAGGYAAIIQASSLDPIKRRKIDDSIFEKNITNHLESYEPKDKISHLDIKYTPTIILGDTHFPFAHRDSIKKAIEYIGLKKPKRIIQIGDLYDMLSHSKFPRSHNIYTPKDEMSEGRKGASKMWEEIRKLVPQAECYQILGNHDSRPMKRVLENYPEIELFLDFEKFFTFDGVKTEMDTRQELIIDGIAYIHGFKPRLGEHMEFLRRPVVCGHTHKPGVVYKNYGDSVLFELNVGYLGDPESKALSYTPIKHTHSSHSLGEIDQFGPRVVLL